jgi:hypothetical protein
MLHPQEISDLPILNSSGTGVFGISSANKTECRRSISSGHKPTGAELEQMVIIEGLLMEVVSIVLQHSLTSLYPVVTDDFQFRAPNFVQNFLNASETILWPGELLPCQCRLLVTEQLEVIRCHVLTIRRMGSSNNRISAEKFSEAFERWTRQLSRCKLCRREYSLRSSGNTVSSSGSII